MKAHLVFVMVAAVLVSGLAVSGDKHTVVCEFFNNRERDDCPQGAIEFVVNPAKNTSAYGNATYYYESGDYHEGCPFGKSKNLGAVTLTMFSPTYGFGKPLRSSISLEGVNLRGSYESSGATEPAKADPGNISFSFESGNVINKQIWCYEN